MGLPVAVGAGVHYQAFASASNPPHTGQFFDGLCSCANEPKLYLVTLCCPAVTIAQLWERVMAGSRGMFFAVFVPLALCGYFVAAMQQECPPPTVECRPTAHSNELPHCTTTAPARGTESPMCSLAGSAQAIAALAAVALLVIIRYVQRPALSLCMPCACPVHALCMPCACMRSDGTLTMHMASRCGMCLPRAVRTSADCVLGVTDAQATRAWLLSHRTVVLRCVRRCLLRVLLLAFCRMSARSSPRRGRGDALPVSLYYGCSFGRMICKL